MQAHSLLVFVHCTSHPGLVSRGHVGAASASLAAAPSPATPNSDAPANLSARRLVMVPLANALAISSKARPDRVISCLFISSPLPKRRASPFSVGIVLCPDELAMNHWPTSKNLYRRTSANLTLGPRSDALRPLEGRVGAYPTGATQYPACGLPRTPLPGTWVNRGQKKGRGC
jgi:hypothetical protein